MSACTFCNGLTLAAPCPVCTAPMTWEQARATMRPARKKSTRPARGASRRGVSARAPVATSGLGSARQSSANPPATPAPTVAACGNIAPIQRGDSLIVACALHKGHQGAHSGGRMTWADGPLRAAGGQARPAPVSASDVRTPAPVKVAVLSAPPARKDGSAPAVVGAEETTEPETEIVTQPRARACGKDVDVGVGRPVSCVLAYGHGGACSAVLAHAPAKDWPTAPVARREAPSPAPTRPAVKTVWQGLTDSTRASVLKLLRGTWAAGDVMKGIYQTVRLAGVDAFPAREVELRRIDGMARAELLTAGDDAARWDLYSDACWELGFDPRTEDGPRPAGVVDGARLLAELLGDAART